jgi:hypothetical protein
MAQATNTYAAYTAMDVQTHEDLLDFMCDVTPDETPLLSMLQRVPATAVKHEFLEDTTFVPTTSASGFVGAIDGDERAADAQAQPARRVNYNQICRRDYIVSGTMDAVDNAGVGSWSGYQMMKALKEIALQAEISLINGTLAGTPQGTSGIARRMAGIDGWFASPSGGTVVSAGLGTMTEANFNLLFQQIWTASMSPDTVLASPTLKSLVSGYTTVARIHHDSGVNDPRTVVRNVQRYESDFGTVDIHLSRFIQSANNPHGYAFRKEFLRTAWLRPPAVEELGKAGDARKLMVLAELTLEVLTSKVGGKWSSTGV